MSCFEPGRGEPATTHRLPAGESDPERALEVAELRAEDPAGRAAARDLAAAVLERFPAGALAVRARRLLDRLDRASSVVAAPDGELEAVRTAWARLHGLDDGRLLQVWSQIGADRERFAALRSEVEQDLTRWLEGLLSELRQGDLQDGDESRKLEACDRLLTTPTFRDHFEVALRGVVDALRETRFAHRLAQLQERMENDLALWRVAAAEERLESLGEPPAGISDEPLRRIRRRLDAVAERRRSVEELRCRLETVGEIADWAALRRCLELLAQGCRRLVAGDLPPDLRGGLERAAEAARGTVVSFLRRRVEAARDEATVRELGHQLERLGGRFELSGLELEPGLFEPALEVLEQGWRERMQAADDPSALEELAADLAVESARLPTPLADACRRWAVRVRRAVETWTTLRRGEPCDDLAAEPMPQRLLAEHQEHRRLDEEIREARELLRRAPSAARRVQQQARHILRRFPGHAEATRLAQEAARVDVEREADGRLARLGEPGFDLQAYCDVAGVEVAPKAHRVLAARRDVVTELHRLLAEPLLEEAQRAMAWWIGFAEAVRAVPSPDPARLRARLDEEAQSRREQWSLVLDRALAGEASAEHFEHLARGLEEIVGEARFDPAGELERYRRELLCRAGLARATELLDGGHFDRARQALAEVEGDAERRRDLEVRLAVEGARARGDLTELATALERHWGRAMHIYGDRAVQTLLAALEEAWERQVTEALSQLRVVARRSLRGEGLDDRLGNRVVAWLAWLDLEDKVRGGLVVSEVAPLVSSLAEPPPEVRRRRARRLAAAWRAGNCVVSLAWAFQAWPHLRGEIFPDGADPADGLQAQLAALGSDVDEWFENGGADDGTLADLEATAHALLQRGRSLEGQLREIDDLLDELPCAVERPAADESARRALRQVESLLTILHNLRELAASDLRHEADRWSRTSTRCRELPRAPWWRLLIGELSRLAPLTRLTYDENRLHDAARHCGNPEALDDHGAFLALADRLRVVVDKLNAAGCLSAPVARAIADEYWRDLPRIAGDRGAWRGSTAAPAAALAALIARCERLEEDELRFRDAIRELSSLQREPVVGADGHVDARRHAEYFALVPQQAPESSRAHWLFERFLNHGERRSLFGAGVDAALVPPWVAAVLRGESP